MKTSIKSLKREIKLFRKMKRSGEHNYPQTVERRLRSRELILDSLMSDKRVLH